MDTIKQKINRYIQLKESLKSMNEEKKELEKSICDTMSENNLTSIELPNGSVINYQTRESISIKKDKE
jgi:hypothetical protein